MVKRHASPRLNLARISIVTSQLTPQRLPTYLEMVRSVGRLDVIAFQGSESNRIWSPPRTSSSGPNVHIAKGFHAYVRGLDWGVHVTRGVKSLLGTLKPDVIVVTGYENNGYWDAASYARRHGIPLVIWWGSHAKSHRFSRGLIARLRRRFLRKGDYYITYGTMAASALLDMDIPADRISIGCNTSNIADFLPIGEARRPRPVDGSVEPTAFLFVGQLLPRKGILELVDAIQSLAGRATLNVVGYGPLEPEIRARIASSPVENIRLSGPARTTADLRNHYERAEVLVMPSHREVWGLVSNEGLAAGLYVVAGEDAGCVPDLIEAAPEDIGAVCNVEDPQALLAALQHAILRITTGFDGRIASRWSAQHGPAAYARSALKAIQNALEAQ